ncbi:hypothetical protein CAEBREN_30586 [Caenorhabditis brenneri]|uniref:CYtochrome P450 family n=1 Tax=Caenorhabditis brenneri TaxID=135651 RepID=G0PG81_CAEBE|nr:hypothetical protein CAEBREN_30586 [Caenorhabditis brenneri]
MIFLILSTIGLLYFFDLWYWKRRNLPPGPIPLPLIGNLYLFREETKPGYKLWDNLRKKYGGVFTFWMANLPMVFVTDWKLIKQHLIKDGGNFVGRPEFPISMEIRKGAYGILESYGPRWVQARRFTLHILRDFGLGKNLMEQKVIGEVEKMLEILEKIGKSGVDMQNIFDASVGSIINSLLFGYRFDETNMHQFLELKARLNQHFKLGAEPIGTLTGMYPWLGRLPVLSNYKKATTDNWAALMKFFRQQVEEKLAIIDYDSEGNADYVDAFLKERKKNEDKEDFGGFEMEQLDSVCFDLWVAGMETTSNTLYWSLLFVLKHPEVLKKVYEELDQKVGSDRIITIADRNNLNYVNATINESQRLANLLPMNLSRTTTADVRNRGLPYPKRYKIFPEPYEFRPERFLEEGTGNLKKVEELCPFSIGKRQCPGEGLAKMELFLFFSNLFNKFRVEFHPDSADASIEKDFGLTVKARNYKVVMTKRY